MATILNNFKIDDPGMPFKGTVRGHPFSMCMHVMINFLTSLPLVGTCEHLGYHHTPTCPLHM